MGGHSEMHQAPALLHQHQENINNPEPYRRRNGVRDLKLSCGFHSERERQIDFRPLRDSVSDTAGSSGMIPVQWSCLLFCYILPLHSSTKPFGARKFLRKTEGQSEAA